MRLTSLQSMQAAQAHRLRDKNRREAVGRQLAVLGRCDVQEADKAGSRIGGERDECLELRHASPTAPAFSPGWMCKASLFYGVFLSRRWRPEHKLSRNTRGQAHHFASLAAAARAKSWGQKRAGEGGAAWRGINAAAAARAGGGQRRPESPRRIRFDFAGELIFLSTFGLPSLAPECSPPLLPLPPPGLKLPKN